MKDEARKKGLLLIAGLALLVGLAAGGAWLARRVAGVRVHPSSFILHPSEDDDPRRTYTGPYRNIDPAVRYVGDARCAECHADISARYARHPMGRSLVPVAALVDRQRYSSETNNPFTLLGRRFRVETRDRRMWHQQAVPAGASEPVVELAQEAHWAIGSGQKGYSYLSERDGYLLQTAISWFSQQQRWDLSPGFPPTALAGRVVQASCLFCHTNRLRQHPEHPDRFLPPVFEGHAIGCERCHGPGELHAASDFDHTIVNPARLAPHLRDAVCEQCHLEGEARVLRSGRGLFDFRPGLPLHDFWAVLVRRAGSVRGRSDDEDARAVTHVEQMAQSKCFQRPVGDHKLGCTSCHDPHDHVGPDRRVAHYRAACLKCHDEARRQRGCSVPLTRRRQTSPQDSCIDCHMPRYSASDIAHTASTDHRIVRRPSPPRQVHAPNLDNALLVDFYRDRFAQPDPQAERNLGMGLVKALVGGLLDPRRHGQRALFLHESALARHPDDAELRQSKAQLLELLGRPGEALGEVRTLLARKPGDWRLLAQAARAYQVEGQTERALDCWRQAVKANPCVPDFHVNLVALLLRAGQHDEARQRCRELLRLDPFNVSGRQAWVGFLLKDGNKARARAEFDIIRKLAPPDLAKRQEWFDEQIRSSQIPKSK
jgi:predicted CXXCH cytochrome family protein